MFNRFKLLVLAIIIIVLTTLFLQNQEPLSLKFFCPDNESEYCFYQTPAISLAVWMAMSILSGILLSLVWQLLNRASSSNKREGYSSSQSSRRRSTTKTNYREQSKLREEAEINSLNPRKANSPNPNNFQVSDWEQSRSDNWEGTNLPNFAKDYKVPETSFQDTTDVNKFPQDGQSNVRTAWASQSRQNSSSKEKANPKNAKPPVAQNKEEVYDANYRTLNDVPPPSRSEGAVTEEEDSDWI